MEADLGQPNVDLAALQATAKRITGVGEAAAKTNLAGMSELDLLHLRQEIDTLLPTKALADMDMEEELVSQYQLAKLLQNSVHANTDKGVSDKEKGQLLRMATTTLEALIRLQNATYTSEKIKSIEIALGLAFEDVPLEIRSAFVTKYEALIRESTGKRKK